MMSILELWNGNQRSNLLVFRAYIELAFFKGYPSRASMLGSYIVLEQVASSHWPQFKFEDRSMKCTHFIFIACLCLLVAVNADQYPGNTLFFQRIEEILQGIKKDRIMFYHLVKSTSWWSTTYSPALRDTMTRADVCKQLTTKHNQHNAQKIGVTISMATCGLALATGFSYSKSDWNAWSGKHCGKWYSDGGSTFIDHAQWQRAKNDATYTGAFRQDVIFLGRPTKCTNDCRNGWNGSSPNQQYVWGWDPKEDQRSHIGYQGTHVGCPLDAEGVKCIIWVTGEEAFLECVGGGIRTSAGFWGYGHWEVKDLSSSC